MNISFIVDRLLLSDLLLLLFTSSESVDSIGVGTGETVIVFELIVLIEICGQSTNALDEDLSMLNESFNDEARLR
ncbi:hypothetical protein BLOT_015800 [Blomia tropicalis]|nr:hypothetical protein BLOT_015800 [Blomia tropicalis]